MFVRILIKIYLKTSPFYGTSDTDDVCLGFLAWVDPLQECFVSLAWNNDLNTVLNIVINICRKSKERKENERGISQVFDTRKTRDIFKSTIHLFHLPSNKFIDCKIYFSQFSPLARSGAFRRSILQENHWRNDTGNYLMILKSRKTQLTLNKVELKFEF